MVVTFASETAKNRDPPFYNILQKIQLRVKAWVGSGWVWDTSLWK